MNEIITLLACLEQNLDATTIRQLSRVAGGMLAMTGRVTMLGISRWAGKGGSYRTVQRLFNRVLPWGQLLWLFFRTHLHDDKATYILVGDESVVTKAGKKTHGLDRFFSSIYSRVVPGLSFFTLAVVNIEEGVSYPLLVEQIEGAQQVAKVADAPKPAADDGAASKRKPGRPKGSKQKDKAQFEWTPELKRLQTMGSKLLALIGGLFPLTYLVLDGHFGNNSVLQVVRQQLGLHLISKLRNDSALFFQYEGPQKKFGPRRRYGDKVCYQAIPDRYRVASTQDKQVRTDIYQATMLHQCFAQPLNVVILVKVNLTTGARAHVVLFSSDLALPYETLIHYYRLRFQIEFNFRDAKQFWGFEDFMTTQQTPVTNSANLAFFMVNLAHLLLRTFRRAHPNAGTLDLKAYYRGYRYAQATLECLPQQPTPDLFDQIVQQVAALGAIHSQSATFTPA
jgi:putative transposase